MKSQKIDSDQWVEQYGDMMFRYTLLRVRDTDTAEEIVQTAFVSALQSKDSFQGRSTEKSWLFGILKHKILDHFRDAKKNVRLDSIGDEDGDPLEYAYNKLGAWNKMPQHWRTDPAQAAENTELMQVLAGCLDGLSDKFRRIFVLKEIEGLSSEEICKEFDIQSTNLWVILHRARNQLKLCLETKWFDKK